MHSLEDAIAIVYGADSDTPHPLLVKCKDEEVEEEPSNLKSTKEEAEEKEGDSPALLDALEHSILTMMAGTVSLDHLEGQRSAYIGVLLKSFLTSISSEPT